MADVRPDLQAQIDDLDRTFKSWQDHYLTTNTDLNNRVNAIESSGWIDKFEALVQANPKAMAILSPLLIATATWATTYFTTRTPTSAPPMVTITVPAEPGRAKTGLPPDAPKPKDTLK